MKKTPSLNCNGRFVLKAPWVANPNVLYTCAAIRNFNDIYKLGIDVYKVYYESTGVVNGALIDGSAFSFDQEKQLQPSIITLLGNDNSVIYVPDTFITRFPDLSEVKYSHMVLSVSLGALPDYMDLSGIKANVAGLIAQSIGVVPVVNEHRAPGDNNPTQSQHDALEVARAGAITILGTTESKLLKAQQDLQLAYQKIAALTAIIAN